MKGTAIQQILQRLDTTATNSCLLIPNATKQYRSSSSGTTFYPLPPAWNLVPTTPTAAILPIYDD